MDGIHRNYDQVFKEAMTIFKDKALDFLGLKGIAPITEPLRTESVEIEIKSEFSDLTFGTQDGKGLHFEEEADLSKDDMLRFGGYHIGLSRVYKREFITVIFVKNPTTLSEIRTEQLNFKPVIVQCSNIDADETLNRIRKAIAAGEPVNELEAIYLPLFHSKTFSPTELFLESAGLIKAMQTDDNHKRKILALLITLAGKVVEQSQLDVVAEEVRKMGNVIIEYFEEYGEKRGKEKGLKEGRIEGLREGIEETARKMVSKGYDSLEIIDLTGLSVERVREIREAVRGAV